MRGKATHAERVLTGRVGAYTMLARHDAREVTRPAHEAFWRKFETEVDPEGRLDPVERARRADMARKAHFTRLALKSAQVRRHRREAAARRTASAQG